MKCLYPRIAFDTGRLTESGKRKLVFKAPRGILHPVEIPVPCGRCAACLKSRRDQWIYKMQLELFSTPANLATFVTLTFDDIHVPPCLRKSDLQKFFKRLRFAVRDYDVTPFSLRYFACGEYGSHTHRPHYHAILFGVDMVNDATWRPYICGFTNGRPRYASAVLEHIWPFGFNVVGACSLASIRYVSKYVSKQLQSKDFPCSVPPFILFSQGLGRSFFVDVSRRGRSFDYLLKPSFYDLYESGFVVLPSLRGFSPVPIPRVVSSYAERFAPSLFESRRASARQFSLNYFDGASPLVRACNINHNLADELKKGELDYD